MKIRIALTAVVLAAGAAFAAGCSFFGGPGPSEVARRQIEAVKEMDFEKVAALSEGRLKEEAKKGVAELAELKHAEMDGSPKARDKAAKMAKMREIFENIVYEIKGEKIEGDFAVVEVSITVNGKTSADQIHLKKVGGDWKVIDKSEAPKAEPTAPKAEPAAPKAEPAAPKAEPAAPAK
jgi:hypothetical protein